MFSLKNMNKLILVLCAIFVTPSVYISISTPVAKASMCSASGSLCPRSLTPGSLTRSRSCSFSSSASNSFGAATTGTECSTSSCTSGAATQRPGRPSYRDFIRLETKWVVKHSNAYHVLGGLNVSFL